MRLAVLISILVICPFCYAQEDGTQEETVQEGAGPAQEVSGFSLTQYEDGGQKKWELNGKSAEVEDEKVMIKEISAVAFGEDTTLKLKAKEGNFNRKENIVHLENNVVIKTTDGTRLTTDSLDWDAKTRNVSTDDAVNIKKADFNVNGIGAQMDLEGKTAKLKRDVTANITSVAPDFLRTTNDESRLSAEAEAKAETTITCDGPLDINYKKHKATFLNNVLVEDAQGNIFSDRIDVYFSKDTRRIRCVVARGNVRIVNGENVTYSEKAIYLVDQGRVVLPKRPKLVIQSEAAGQF